MHITCGESVGDFQSAGYYLKMYDLICILVFFHDKWLGWLPM